MPASTQPSPASTDARVLAALQRAGRRGVPYVRIREMTAEDPELVLDRIRADGHLVQRTPSDHGVIAVHLGEVLR